MIPIRGTTIPYLDRNKQLQAQRNHYQANKPRHRDLRKERKFKFLGWFREEVLSKLKCIKCGESDSACLDFHHRDPAQKEYSVCNMVKNMKNKELIFKEIAKCDVLCSNCHRKHHYYENHQV